MDSGRRPSASWQDAKLVPQKGQGSKAVAFPSAKTYSGHNLRDVRLGTGLVQHERWSGKLAAEETLRPPQGDVHIKVTIQQEWESFPHTDVELQWGPAGWG